ncbi:hypothetical protein [Streptomyces melanosporofaciens]|uniref:Secreted protein n=1 Tax=Streptomyces melanosporofaciens TaxID=67327 RepID=A0A1H4N2Q2_STRMJ|nr:hypothetical protein [Streptomyces melanosporofaciens]SEB89148.1 hypothetical protein SAMN04490356_2078 [Streptomyces melanosporofaciens]
MEAIWILLLLFVLIMLAGVYAAVRAVRAAKRGIDRTVHQARRTVEETRLRARQFAQPGAAGELAQLRLSLRGSMRATSQALQAAAPQDQSLSESLVLFQRLSAHALDLEADLKRLEQEPDKSRLAALLPDLRQRTERITHSADSLRWAVQERTQRFAHDDLDSLNREIEMEAGALRHWTAVEPEEPRTDAGSWPPPEAGTRPETGARPEAGSRPEAGARSGPEAGREPEPPRPSLGARPQTEPQAWQKPWQQSRRPENTA